MVGTHLASSLAGLLVLVSVQVVVVHVLGSVLALGSLRLQVVASVGDVEPAGFGFIGKSDITSVVPSEPSPHSVGKIKDFVGGLFVQPVVERALEAVGVGADLFGELALEAREHIIEGKGVGRQVHPSGVSSEDGQSLAGPQTVTLAPCCDIGVKLSSVFVESLEVQFPGKRRALSVEVLLEDGSPFGIGNSSVNSSVSTSQVMTGKVNAVSVLDV